MGLAIRSLTLEGFRSYKKRFSLSDIGRLTILCGPNAVGKTNVIEALQLITAHETFRHAPSLQLVNKECEFADISVELEGDDRRLDLELVVGEGKKKFLLNGKPRQARTLKGLIPSITFTPDDLDLVKGGMSVKRQALDSLGGQLSANHDLIRRDYERVVRHKNHLLRDDASDALIDSIDEMLVTVGAQLCCYRAALFSKLAAHAALLYEDIAGSGEPFFARYVPSWMPSSDSDLLETASFGRNEARAALADALAARRREERARRRSVVGPHADSIDFFIAGSNVRYFASQGQQRTAVLAYKLAEVAVVEEIVGQKPVLLLDDVMSELDASRRTELVSFIEEGMQTFITTTNLDYFDPSFRDSARVVFLPMDGKDGGLDG